MRKQNLFVSLVMLLVTAVALTTASYAWFTANIAVTLTGLQINVEAAEGIQVSTDAETWRAALSVSDLENPYEGHVNQLPQILEPVSTIGVLPGVENEGFFTFFDGELQEGAETTLETTLADPEAAGDEGNYVAFDLYLRSATEEEIYLADGSQVVYVPDDEEPTVGLEWTVRVGFLYQGTQGDHDAELARALDGGTSATQAIWEPNARTHTAWALNNGAIDGDVHTYYGVKAEGTELQFDNPGWAAVGEDPWEGPGETPGFDGYFEEVTTLTVDTDDPAFDIDPSTVLFTIQPGISKIRVYVWIEGQDIDTENSVSLGIGNIQTDIRFTLDDSEE